MIPIENIPILQEVDLLKWHDAGYTGKDVTIVLLDSKTGDPREHMKDWYFDVLDKYDDTGHATNVGYSAHVAAPGIRVLYFSSTHSYDEAIEWTEAHKDEIDLINISMAGIAGRKVPKYEQLERLGIPVVCASGNDGWDDQISYPARYDFTIAIGAWFWNTDQVAYYSNGGPELDAVAPSGIYMTRDDGYVWSVQGTSFASPFACGMLACYIQWRKENGLPKLTPQEARKYIHENALDVRDIGFDYRSGHGLFKMPDVQVSLPKQPKPTPEPLPIPKPDSNTFYRVVTGSFADRANAENRVKAIKEKGFDSFLLAFDADGQTMFRVITGSFQDRINADTRIDELKQVGFESFIAIYKK